MTELGAYHDWDLADRHLILREYTLLRFDCFLFCEWIYFAFNDLKNLHVAKNFSLIGQIANSCRVRHDWFVSAIALVQPRKLIYRRLAEDYLKSSLFIVLTKVLLVLFDGLLPKLINNLLDRVDEESLE